MRKSLITSLIIVIFVLAVAISAGCQNHAEQDEIEVSELVRGIWENNRYINEFAGLTYTIPTGWLINTDDEIKSMIGTMSIMGVKQGIVAQGIAYSEGITKVTPIYDMAVTNPVTGCNLLVLYENLYQYNGGGKTSAKQYLESIKEQLKALGDEYTFDNGLRNTMIDGELYQVLDVEIVSLSLVRTYYVRRIDNCLLVIIETLNKDEPGFMENFSGLQ